VPTYGNAQVAGFWETITTALGDVILAYGWILPALALTALLIGVYALLCFMVEDVVEIPIFSMVRRIFHRSRRDWIADRRSGTRYRTVRL
jgi:hypothetical protein